MLGTFCKHQSYANPSMWEGFDCRVFPWLQGVSGQPFRLGSAVPKWLQEVGKAIVEEESRFHALSSMCSWPMMSNRRHHDEVFGDGCVLWFMFIYIYIHIKYRAGNPSTRVRKGWGGARGGDGSQINIKCSWKQGKQNWSGFPILRPTCLHALESVIQQERCCI